MDNITNKKYKLNLVQVIDIDIRDTIDLEEVIFPNLNIIQNKSHNKIVGSSCDQNLSIKFLNRVQQIDRKNLLIELRKSRSENQLHTTSVYHKRSTINTTDFNKSFTLNLA